MENPTAMVIKCVQSKTNEKLPTNTQIAVNHKAKMHSWQIAESSMQKPIYELVNRQWQLFKQDVLVFTKGLQQGWQPWWQLQFTTEISIKHGLSTRSRSCN